MTLRGPSRTITVEPLAQPREASPPPAPEPPPDISLLVVPSHEQPLDEPPLRPPERDSV